MSKRHSMPEMKEGGVNVTPLIDVVMCLIIFFMLVAKIGVSTGAKPMPLPETVIGKKLDQIPDTVFLNIVDPNIVHDEKGNPVRKDPNDPNSAFERMQAAYKEDPDVYATFDTTAGNGLAEPIALRGGGVPATFPLREKLQIMYNARKAQGPEKEKSFSVTVRAEADLPYSMLERVLAEIAQVGIVNVNYAAVTPAGEKVQSQK